MYTFSNAGGLCAGAGISDSGGVIFLDCISLVSFMAGVVVLLFWVVVICVIVSLFLFMIGGSVIPLPQLPPPPPEGGVGGLGDVMVTLFLDVLRLFSLPSYVQKKAQVPVLVFVVTLQVLVHCSPGTNESRQFWWLPFLGFCSVV